MNLTLKELIMSFTKSVDLYNFLLKNHHRRVAIIAYHIGKAFGLDPVALSDLVVAASLHDVGALTVRERDQLIKMDVEKPYPHCYLGSYMLETFEPFDEVSRIVFYHHWRYDRAESYVPEKGTVPMSAYILHISDRIEILIDEKISILEQRSRILKTIKAYDGTLFHPEIVEVFETLSEKDHFWLDIDNLGMNEILTMALNHRFDGQLNLDTLEQFALTLSKFADFRSAFVVSHSIGVSEMAYHIGKMMGYSEEKCRKLRIAGLLHDMGKIAIPMDLIEKHGSLTSVERMKIRSHAYFTALILKGLPELSDIARWAAGHHENHDGTGYPENLMEDDITVEMDIIAYADLYTALSENRPYRESLSPDVIIKILSGDYKARHGSVVFDVIESNLMALDQICKNAVKDGIEHFKAFTLKMNQYEESAT